MINIGEFIKWLKVNILTKYIIYSFLLLSTRRSHSLSWLSSCCALQLLHHLLLIHLLRIIDVDVWPLFFCNHLLLLLVIIKHNWQILKHILRYLIVFKVLYWTLNKIQIHHYNVLLSKSWIVIAARYSHSSLGT
jgi:hypothetical protein